MKNFVHRTLACLLALQPMVTSAANSTSLDLAGEWSIRIDRDDVGIAEQWHSQDFENVIVLPGSLQEAGYGDEPAVDSPWMGNIQHKEWDKAQYQPYKTTENFKIPFWLQPDKIYAGAAWYQRDVEIPAGWKGQHIVLHLERAHWETRVWVDGNEISSQNSLGAPHEHDLSNVLTPGKHRISIRVDNRMIVDVGNNAHSVTDHTQSNWNGLTGELKLTATPPVWLEDVQVYPDAKNRNARVVVKIGNRTDEAGSSRLAWRVTGGGDAKWQGVKVLSWSKDGASDEFQIELGPDALLWDEFSPNLYKLEVALEIGDQHAVTFGLRDFKVDGTRFTINDRPVFLRGTLECAVFPLTGYPPTDVESWRRIMRITKDHGLNHIRFHSWCPPEAAFVAADEEGVYLQAECSAWAKIGTGAPVDAWLYEEGEHITKAYGNHPSFVMMAYGNEPSGPERGAKFLRPWVKHWKEVDPRRLHTGAGGWPRLEENDYHNVPNPRIHQWGARLRSRLNSRAPETKSDYAKMIQDAGKPIIAHETGEWTVYPNFDEIKKYTGVLKAKNYEVFRDFLDDHHMADQAEDFLMASGYLQVLCYKEEIESALRTPGFAGFQLLGLTDFPGQGTAPVGVLDAFWDEKPYINAAAFREFCDVTVPLARLSKRTWTAGETFSADLEVSHFGATPIKNTMAKWTILSADNEAVASGATAARDIPIDNAITMGRVQLDLKDVAAPAEYTLVVNLEGTDARNSWKFWVYSESVETTSPGVTVVDSMDAALTALKPGAKVLLLARGLVENKIEIGFSANFWNMAWTSEQAPHTMGILCDPKHPVFAAFPTEYHSDWQWWELIHDSRAMILEKLPPDTRPLVQTIDNWFSSRRLGALLEANVNGGKLMVSSLSLDGNLKGRPAARQLYASIVNYMNSQDFRPKHDLTVEQIDSIFKP